MNEPDNSEKEDKENIDKEQDLISNSDRQYKNLIRKLDEILSLIEERSNKIKIGSKTK